jgi:hypothetical protein
MPFLPAARGLPCPWLGRDRLPVRHSRRLCDHPSFWAALLCRCTKKKDNREESIQPDPDHPESLESWGGHGWRAGFRGIVIDVDKLYRGAPPALA